jgi:MarR family 2-MHQ and catechol resistance regulon transcriptional repressor
MPTHYRGTREEVLALNTFIKLTRAAESLLARLHRCGTQGDLTPSQFGVLESLYHLGPMSHSEIATKLLKSSGNITLIIDNLERQGLVQRERDADDRRLVTVSLTAQGRDLIGSVLPGHVAAIVREMSALTADEQATLGHLCRKLGKYLEEHRPVFYSL